jgi:hypothetical protein
MCSQVWVQKDGQWSTHNIRLHREWRLKQQETLRLLRPGTIRLHLVTLSAAMVLWHIDPLMRGNSGVGDCTAARKLKTGKVFSVRYLQSSYKQGKFRDCSENGRLLWEGRQRVSPLERSLQSSYKQDKFGDCSENGRLLWEGRQRVSPLEQWVSRGTFSSR